MSLRKKCGKIKGNILLSIIAADVIVIVILIMTVLQSIEELLSELPEFKNEVDMIFTDKPLNPQSHIVLYILFNSWREEQFNGVYFNIGIGKPTIIIYTARPFRDVLRTTFHELGHYYFNERLTKEERESFCQNSVIEPKKDYDESDWCGESYADYYAGQGMVNYENQATLFS